MKRRVKVYIASPYTNGDKEQNVRMQVDATYHLLMMGFNPYMPIYHHFIQKEHPDLDNVIPWLEIDKEWLAQCDMAIRIHPKDENGIEILSKGADEEEQFCTEKGIPMMHFGSIEEMVHALNKFNSQI